VWLLTSFEQAIPQGKRGATRNSLLLAELCPAEIVIAASDRQKDVSLFEECSKIQNRTHMFFRLGRLDSRARGLAISGH
jgi:16S rRNA U516 pseudouridylate synthase RsuA-like enzyme